MTLTREQVELVRDWMMLMDRNGAMHEQELRALCDLALRGLEAGVVVPRELPVSVLVNVCGSDHPDDYSQVAETWKMILDELAAAPKGESR